jgi:basic membrane protein A
MGVTAEKLTGKKVLPATPEEIRAKVEDMRKSQPSWIWDAVAELESKIRSGEVEGPCVTTQELVNQWRSILG